MHVIVRSSVRLKGRNPTGLRNHDEIIMKSTFTFIVLVAILFAVPSVAGERPARFDPKRDADRDIHEAITEAKLTAKRVLLDVGGEWCIWCHRLDTLFATNPDLDEFMHNNFVVVKINYSNENKNEKVLSQYPKIPGYPHLFVLDG